MPNGLYLIPVPHFLPFLPFLLRYIGLLETQISKMDEQYDACNTAMAQGEVNGFDAKFLNSYVSSKGCCFEPEINYKLFIVWVPCFIHGPLNQDSLLMQLQRWKLQLTCTDLRYGKLVLVPHAWSFLKKTCQFKSPLHVQRCSAACALEMKTRNFGLIDVMGCRRLVFTGSHLLLGTVWSIRAFRIEQLLFTL